MNSLFFFVGSLFSFLIVGLPFISTRNNSTLQRDLIAAPVIGSAILVIALTLLYRFGLSPQSGLLGTTATAALIAAYRFAKPLSSAPRILDRSSRSYYCCLWISLLFVISIILLPHILGGENFSIFQTNHGDTINYLSMATGYANFSLIDLSHYKDPLIHHLSSLSFAATEISSRPSVTILYAALYKSFSLDVITNAYDFCLLGQINLFLALLCLLLTLFPSRAIVGIIVSVAFSTGFFGQYILDSNAWSMLFAIPLVVVLMSYLTSALVGELRLSHETLRRASLREMSTIGYSNYLPLAAVASGILYVYPEITGIAGLLCVGSAVAALVTYLSFGRWPVAIRMGLRLSFLIVIALTLAAISWSATIGLLFRQIAFPTSVAKNWHMVTLTHLMGTDQNSFSLLQLGEQPLWDYIYSVFSLPIDFVSGLIGLYFIQPTSSWDIFARVLYKAFLGIIIIVLIIMVCRSVRSAFEKRWRGLTTPGRLQLRYLLIGVFLAFVIPAYFVSISGYWHAGKALSMLSPFLFLIIMLPLFVGKFPTGIRTIFWMIVIIQLMFALYRPYAVASRGDGLHYLAPYPAFTWDKIKFDWDVPSYNYVLRGCRLVKVDVDSGFVERVVQNYLIDQNIRWFATREQNTVYGLGQDIGFVRAPHRELPDCEITTKPGRGGTPQTGNGRLTIINLLRKS